MRLPWLRETISKLGITSIFVTHDQDEAVEVADEIIITNKGKIEQKGTPVEIYKNPKTPFVAQFIGESNLIEDYTKLKGFEDNVKETKAIVRPEFIQLAKNDSEILTPLAAEKGIVKGTAFRGSNIEVEVQIGEQLLSGYRSLEEEPLKIGEEILILIHRVYAFNDRNAKVIENKIKTQEMSVFI